jgi:hypothetical protein
MRAALRRTPADHFAQVRLCRRQTLHAHVRVFELHGPFARGGLHRTCATRPSLRLLVNLPSGGRVLDLDVLPPPPPPHSPPRRRRPNKSPMERNKMKSPPPLHKKLK